MGHKCFRTSSAVNFREVQIEKKKEKLCRVIKMYAAKIYQPNSLAVSTYLLFDKYLCWQCNGKRKKGDSF